MDGHKYLSGGPHTLLKVDGQVIKFYLGCGPEPRNTSPLFCFLGEVETAPGFSAETGFVTEDSIKDPVSC